MESVHDIQNRPWITRKFKVEEMKREWADLLKNYPKGKPTGRVTDKSQIKELMHLADPVAKGLQDECGLHTLIDEEEPLDKTLIPPHVDLMTLKLLKQDLERREKDEVYKYSMAANARMCRFPSKVSYSTCEPVNTTPGDLIQLPEVALMVHLFKPISLEVTTRRSRPAGAFNYKTDSEIVVLGCQKLITLKSKIKCISDVAVSGDFSENPEESRSVPHAEEFFQSSFFFIDDTFYNDLSSPSKRDISENIREWSKDSKRGVGPFYTKKMEDVAFSELTIRLGYPYVYVHQGYCEHIVVFADIRMLHEEDDLHLSNYPLLMKSYPCTRRMLCMMCQQLTAKWITYENARVNNDPFFFCLDCFRSYNYTVDGKKIGSFKAQPYYDWSSLI